MASNEHSLTVSRVIPASRERVFKAWTDPERLKTWWGPEETQCIGAEVDLRVGGRYRITLLGKSGVPFAVSGSYVEIAAPERLIFTWDWEDADMSLGQDTQVLVEFADLDGKTEVSITHTKFPGQESRDGHEGGWTNLLTKIESVFSTV